jgi:hypothetical protein
LDYSNIQSMTPVLRLFIIRGKTWMTKNCQKATSCVELIIIHFCPKVRSQLEKGTTGHLNTRLWKVSYSGFLYWEVSYLALGCFWNQILICSAKIMESVKIAHFIFFQTKNSLLQIQGKLTTDFIGNFLTMARWNSIL